MKHAFLARLAATAVTTLLKPLPRVALAAALGSGANMAWADEARHAETLLRAAWVVQTFGIDDALDVTVCAEARLGADWPLHYLDGLDPLEETMVRTALQNCLAERDIAAKGGPHTRSPLANGVRPSASGQGVNSQALMAMLTVVFARCTVNLSESQARACMESVLKRPLSEQQMRLLARSLNPPAGQPRIRVAKADDLNLPPAANK